MQSISIALPFPPSVNDLWRSSRGRVHLSKKYRLWISEADGLFLTQKRGPIKMLPGKFSAVLELWTGDGRMRKDADNRMKAPLDFATRVGLILDDRYCEEGTFRWVPKEQAGATGCRLTLTSLEP